MSDPDANKAFIPFNFSSVLPSDAISNALRELPTPQHVEPAGPFSQFPHPPSDVPSHGELAEMTRLVSITAQEEEWGRDVISDVRLAPRLPDGRNPPAWVNSHSMEVSSSLQRSFKRAPSSTPLPPRPTPKRPRPRPSQGPIVPDDPRPAPHGPQDPTRRRTARRYHPSQSEYSRQADHFVPPEQSPGNQTAPSRQQAPRGITAPPRASTAHQRVSAHQRPTARNLSHAQELRRHEDARDVESEDFDKFLKQLTSFSERPDALVSTTYDADEPPALLATGNLGVITDLRQAIALVSRSGAMKHAAPMLLSKVISILQARIRYCAKQCQEANDSVKLSSRDASLGVLAVCVILDILSAPESPRSLLVEELLDDIVLLFRSVMTLIVFPMCDPHFNNSKANNRRKRKQNRSRRAADEVTVLSDEDDREDETSPRAGRGKRMVLLKKDEDLLTHCRLFLNCLTALVEKEKFLPESIISQCLTVCVQSLSVVGIPRLQSNTVRMICMIFSNYPTHRLSIMDEVRETASSVPESKRHLRSFQLAEGNISVRTSSALLGMLLCVASHDIRDAPAPKQISTLSPEAVKTWCNDRETSHKRAVKLAVHVLKPLFSRVSQDREQDFKLAFQTFFDDLLVLFGSPEWPCAELLLQSLSVSIITKMRSGTEKSAHARGVAIDTLGSLAARMAELYGKTLVRQNGLNLQSTGVCKQVEEAREKILLFFHPEKSFHSAFIEAFYEAMFVNDDYSLANNHDRRTQAIASQRNATDRNEDEEVMDGEDGESLDKETIIAELERRAVKRVENVRARRARGEEISREDAMKAAHFISLNRNFVGGFRTILGAIFDGQHDTAPTIRAKAIKALASMDEACPGILRAFPNILRDVGPSCRDISTLVRDAALDLISRSLLEGLKSSKNGSTSADLESHDLCASVFDVVRKRLWDSALSVRKRAIGIMKAVLGNSLDHCRAALNAPASATEVFKTAELHKERIILICTSLISRLEDPEPSVKEAAERTLRFGLFGFDISQALPAKNDNIELAPQLAERLIGVFTKLSANIHLSFISRVVHKAIMIKQGPLLHAIVNSAVEQFHGFEERISTISNIVASGTPNNEDRAEAVLLSSRRVACTSLISAFGSLDASLIENHSRSLAPSIKGVIDGVHSENDLTTVQRILNILEIGIGQSNSVDPSFLNEVLSDVEVIVCHSPIALLEEASVRCLCIVASKIGKDAQSDDVVLNVTNTFKTFLDTRIGEELVELLQSPASTRDESIARCALVRLGLLAKHGNLDDDSIDDVFKTLQEVADLVCQHDRKGLLSRALARALSHFLVKHRRFLRVGTERLVSMLESPMIQNGTNPAKSVMMSTLKEVQSADHGVKLCVFQGFHELLRDEEERNSNKNPDDEAETNGRQQNPDVAANGKKNEHEAKAQVVLAAEEDAEAGFLALSAQTMIPSLKNAVQSTSVPIRRVVSNILGLLVRQGLLLPATIVPSLFILSLDADSHCRDFAFRVISFIADRHSGMLASAAVPALRVCFKTAFDLHPSSQSQAVSKVTPVSPPSNQNKITLPILSAVCIDKKTGHALLSPVIMAMRRDQRRGVLENLMKEFDPRVVVVIKPKSAMNSKEDNGGECRDTVHGNDIRGDMNDAEKVAPGAPADDDDVGEIGDEDIDLEGGTGRCELPGLYFLAMTMACVDYTNGAGVGGSLSHGGGTAAADIKLKYAKEEVNELVATATRIISNSGQAVLRVCRQICQRRGDRKSKGRIAMFAARICVLLSLKYHLKVERWKGNEEDMRGVDDGSNALVRMPAFQPDCELIETVGWEGCMTEMSEEVADRKIEQLFRMMREDAIDEADLTVPSRRGTRNTGKGRGRSSAKRRKNVNEEGSMNTPAQWQRRRASRRASATKQLTYDDGSDDDGSDYNPRGR